MKQPPNQLFSSNNFPRIRMRRNRMSNFSRRLISENNISLDDLLNVIYHSKTTISSHAGLIVHAGAAFEKKVIDIVPENINNELDRWIPFDIDYKRINITNFFESIL